mmetsp:Transcript_21349/g.51418  ORF Transcript_21349/g.51418 Transcript_21349/m.51418 type:complete len:238 (+) Transcript_21349:50-763(+)
MTQDSSLLDRLIGTQGFKSVDLRNQLCSRRGRYGSGGPPRCDDRENVELRDGRGERRDGALALHAVGDVPAHAAALAGRARERVVVVPKRVGGRSGRAVHGASLLLGVGDHAMSHRGPPHFPETPIVVSAALHLGILLRRRRFLLPCGAHARPPLVPEMLIVVPLNAPWSCRRGFVYSCSVEPPPLLVAVAHVIGRESFGPPGRRVDAGAVVLLRGPPRVRAHEPPRPGDVASSGRR